MEIDLISSRTDYVGQESGNVYSNFASWLMYGLVFLMPLFFLPWTTSVLEFNKQALLVLAAGAALILWLLNIVISGKVSWRSTPINLSVLGIIIASIVATILSIARFKSLFGSVGGLSESLISIFALSVAYLLLVNLFSGKAEKIKSILGLSVIIALLFGLLQILNIHLLKPWVLVNSRTFNTIGTINSLGVLSAIFLPFLIKFNSKILNTYVRKFGILVALAILVILNWWILWLVAIFGMLALIVIESLTLSQRGAKFKMKEFLLPMTIIIVAVFLIVVNFSITPIKNNLPIEFSPSFSLSFDVIRSTLMKNPVSGFGPENFSMAFDRFGASRLSNSNLSNAKFFDSTSQLFNFISGGGSLMLLAIGYLIWLFIYYGFWKIKSIDLGDNTGIVASLTAAFAAMFVYPFNISLMFIFFVLLSLFTLGLGDARTKVYNIEDKASTSLASSLGFIGGLILVLVVVYFGVGIYISDAKYAKVLKQTDSQKATQILVESINWNGQDDRYYRLASQVALNLLTDALKKPNNQIQIQNYMSSAVALAKKATEVSPNESANWSNLGNIYQSLLGFVDGVDKLSEDAYIHAANLRPGDPSYYNAIGSTYLSEADLLKQLAAGGGANATKFNALVGPALLKAEDNFSKAVKLSDNYGLAIYNLGIVYDREGKLNEAIAQLEKIAPFNANQPTLAFELGLLYYRAGQKDKAFNALQGAVSLSPSYSDARWYLALIYEERRDLPSAIDQLQQILSIDANKDNSIVLAKLDQLKKGKISIPPQKVIDQKPL